MRKKILRATIYTALAAALSALTFPAAAQQSQSSTPSQVTATAQAPAQTGSAAQQALAAPQPLYGEFRGVRLGMTAEEVRRKLGKPEQKSDVMDFFEFSDRERARVYYDEDKKASAVIATYVGKNSEAPGPAAVLGAEVESNADGSMYKMVTYKQAGYWVAYSRTAGDSPLVMITMQKTP